MYLKRSVAFLALLFITTIAFAQETFTPAYEIGGALGTFIYQGDLTPNKFGSLKSLRPNLTLYGSRTISPTLAVRLNISSGKVNANDADYSTPVWRVVRNFNFSTSITELSGLMVWSPLKKYSSVTQSKFQPYVMGGLGIAFMKGTRDWSNMTTDFATKNPDAVNGLTIDASHSMNKPKFVLPLGAGIKYALGGGFSVFGEMLYRITFSDYIDGFSYATQPYTQTRKPDSYYSVAIGISYTFNKSNVSCPKDVR